MNLEHAHDCYTKVTYTFNIRKHNRKPLCLTDAALVFTFAALLKRKAIAQIHNEIANI